MTLKQLRKDKRMTQQILALLVGVGRTTVTTWENGTRIPDRPNVMRLAQVFGCSYEAMDKLFVTPPPVNQLTLDLGAE